MAYSEVKSIANDPDQPWNPRLQLLASIGLGWVAGVPFYKSGGVEGLILYMAREGVDPARLHSPTNEEYLIAAADMIGAAFALRNPRAAVVMQRREELRDTMRRVRNKLLYILKMGMTLEDLVKYEEDKKIQQDDDDDDDSISKSEKSMSNYDPLRSLVRHTKNRLVATARKSKGSSVQPPPPFSWRQTMVTFVGCFITMIILTRLNYFLAQTRGPDYTIVLG
jgi:hypothetical protein